MREIKPGWIAAAVFGLVVLLFLFSKVSETVRPKPVAVWAAVEPEGADRATVGAVEIFAGAAFRLRAVVEARTYSGETIYYTEAPALEVLGERVAEHSIRRWDRSLEPRILWFTVDGYPPFRERASGEEVREPSFQETFRGDWGHAWTVAADLRPVVENFLPGEDQADRSPRFGTQRFHVRMEFFADHDALLPELRLESWGAADLPLRSREFPAVVASLDGSLAVPSRVFGLAQLETPGSIYPVDLQVRLTDWTRRLVAFSRISVLAEWLRDRDVAWNELTWNEVEIGVSDQPVRPGDLVRVGNRIVWILADRGTLGALDYEDLCLDFDRGARVLRLGNVFTGEGLVAWAAAPARSGA